ncbi:MAG: hypothetical protein NC453_28385, partial [Muribaculum sp.]|nr:hypothetical protein [Muribaculum sp.]
GEAGKNPALPKKSEVVQPSETIDTKAVYRLLKDILTAIKESKGAKSATTSSQCQFRLPDNIVKKEQLDKAVRILTEKINGFKTVTKSAVDSANADAAANVTAKDLAEYVIGAVDKSLTPKLPKVVEDGIGKAFVSQYQRLYDIVNKMRYKADNIIQGQWWRCIPKWIYVMFTVLILATGGFGYGFFSQLNEIDHLKDVEWMYRYLRIGLGTEENQKWLINEEKEFFRGTSYEQDSIKIVIRNLEKQHGLDKTYLHFYPIEE